MSVASKPVRLKRRWCLRLTVAAALLGAAGASMAQQSSTIATGPWGFDIAGQDRTARPGDDFFEFANGRYLSDLAIPSDSDRAGIGRILTTRAQSRVRDLLAAPEGPASTRASGVSQARSLYRAFLDEAAVERAGAQPLAADLSGLNAIHEREALTRFLGRQDGFREAPVTPTIEINLHDPKQYTLVLRQGGLGLPDRDFYLRADARQRDAYRIYVAKLLVLVGWNEADATAAAGRVLTFETELARASLSLAESRDYDANYQVVSLADLTRIAPGFDWSGYIAASGVDGVNQVVLEQARAFPGLAAAWGAAPLDTLKAWAAFHIVDNAAPYLSSPFVNAHFGFHGTTLTGQTALAPRWKRAMDLEDQVLGDAVGRLYVERYFPPAAKAKIEQMVANIKAAMSRRIAKVDWMDSRTKAMAQRKLTNLRVKVGYPDSWRNYSGLTLPAGDLAGSVAAAREFEWHRVAARINGPVDNGEWEVPAHWTFAAFNGGEVLFTAGILQAPYFDPSFDDAVNYGAIGAIIGHEITHAFDDQGRHFNEDGALADWWQPGDVAAFNARTERLVKQYDAFEPFPGSHVNGRQTLGENIADLGGLLVAYDAYHASLRGTPAAARDGMTGDQRFFLGFAQSWREKAREEVARRELLNNPHSPERYRVNGVVRNVDAWYRAFKVAPANKLYVAPADRVRIW